MSSIPAAGVRAIQMPLRTCVLRCDRSLQLIAGGTYGFTRGAGTQFHGGVDLYAKPGTECYAIADGAVEWVQDFGKTGWGVAVLTRVALPRGTSWALYAHLSKVLVKKGTPLGPGTHIGLTGFTGNASAHYPHLHFEIWKSIRAGTKGTHERYRINPLEVLGLLPYQSLATEVIERHHTA